MDITSWIEWFLGCLGRAIHEAWTTLDAIVYKTRFWDAFAGVPLNERQIKIINLLLDGFQGKLTTSKWAKLAECSQDTAYRDIIDLLERKILAKSKEGGRSTSYSLIKVTAPPEPL